MSVPDSARSRAPQSRISSSPAPFAPIWDSRLPIAEKMVLLCLRDFGAPGGRVGMTLAFLAEKCSLSQRDTAAAVARLQTQGFLDDAGGRA